LMEAYEKGLIDRNFLDGIDLKWGNCDAVLQMIPKIANR
jgi:aldehyde:ferredoxin oxidoreductase